MSSQTTCINHPSGSHFVVIYDWQVALCEGNTTTAALLSFFERWHNLKLEMRPKNIQSNNVASAHGDERSQDESTLQFHSEQELIDGIQSVGKRDSVRKSINWLELKGFISIHTNPNKRYSFDKTRYFQFYPDVVNEWLKTRMSINRPPMSKNQSRLSKNQSPSSEDQQPSLEITSPITDHAPEEASENAPEENPPIIPREDAIPAASYANAPLERGREETHAVVVEVVTQDEEVTDKQSPVVQSLTPTSQEQIIPAHENNNQAQKLRPIQQIFEESGKIINYGTEYKDWIQADMGDVIKHYRRSGRALTTSPNDIDSDFKNFTAVNANNGKGMKLSAIQGWVVNCEKDPLRWGELRDLVAEWVLAKTTGSHLTDIAQENNRDAKQQAIANNLMSMLSDHYSQKGEQL